MLVEYDVEWRSPIGLVCRDLGALVAMVIWCSACCSRMQDGTIIAESHDVAEWHFDTNPQACLFRRLAVSADERPASPVCTEEDETVVLRGADGQELAPDGSDSRDGEDVAAIELRRPDGSARHGAAACSMGAADSRVVPVEDAHQARVGALHSKIPRHRRELKM